MQMREQSDWLILNDMIYKIYTTKDIETMCRTFLEQLKMVIDFDSADFMLMNYKEHKMYHPIVHHCESIEIKTLDLSRYNKPMLLCGRSMVYRDSDKMPEGERIKTEYYKKVFQPNNWHYSVQMVLSYKNELCGWVTLFKTIGKEDFSQEDMFLLNMLKDHVCYRIFQDTYREESEDHIPLLVAAEKFSLTKREQQIIEALLRGKKNDEIAENLVISLNTLKKHLMNIYRKMNINSKNQILTMIR